MDTSPRSQSNEHQRFVTVCAMDFGHDLRIVAAEDKAFESAIVCIVSVTLDETVKKWLKQKLTTRCRLYHPHVLKFYDVFLSEAEFHIIFECPKGQSLLSILTKHRLSEDHARHLFQQLVFAIEYFHRMGVEGVDLVLESVFYDSSSGILKTVDFGLSNVKDDKQTYSLPYVTPEQLEHPLDDNRVHRATDVWRLGVMLFCMLFSRFPFCPNQRTTREEHILNILRVKWSVPEGGHLSAECMHLLQRILTVRPNERMTIREIKSHPWYQKNLPAGVMQYESIERPSDGLLTKVENIKEVLAVQTHAYL